jgi:hypothetical protein
MNIYKEYAAEEAKLNHIAYLFGTTRTELCANIQQYPEQVFNQVVKILNGMVQLLVRLEQLKSLEGAKRLPSGYLTKGRSPT